ncbi:MAG: hypothetical protein KBT03_04715 [Bacteroidales bacterium]|nr:hypothetical protein [Candidatus Scybalousia scybalohippi]
MDEIQMMLDMYDELMKASAEFNRFVKLQEGKTTEQIAEEYGINLETIREMALN